MPHSLSLYIYDSQREKTFLKIFRPGAFFSYLYIEREREKESKCYIKYIKTTFLSFQTFVFAGIISNVCCTLDFAWCNV